MIYLFQSNEFSQKMKVGKVVIGYYGEVVALGSLGLLVYKYVFHLIVRLYTSLAVALSVISVTAILGFMYADITPEFFNNPHKLEAKRVAVGMMISLTGMVMAVILFFDRHHSYSIFNWPPFCSN
jgi:hypothetical protein